MISLFIKSFPTFIKYRKFILWIVLISAYFIVYGYGYYTGYSNGKARVEYITIEKYVEGKKNYEQKKTKIRSLNNDDLRKRFCKWVYDIPYDECIRTYNFVE